MDTALQETPLYQFHIDNGARIVPFAGWSMPVQYTGIIDEHMAVRKTAGLFDVSHMGEATVNGKDATKFLDYISTNDVASMSDGQARYSVMCMPEGGCVDDIIIYRYNAEKYLICLNASNAKRDVEWLTKHASGFDCKVKDVSEDYAQLALQGPQADDIFSKLTNIDLKSLKYFHFVETTLSGIPIILARTGYTGEKGFEIYSSPDKAVTIAKLLMSEGKDKGLVLAGLGSRDSLRLEMGYSLYGHEIDEKISPLQAGLGWVVKLKKPNDFIGKQALTSQKNGNMQKKIIFFKMNDRRIARQGTPVFLDGKEVGEVRSGTHSPILNQPIGSALVDSDSANSKSLSARIRNVDYPLDIVLAPFVKTSLTQ